MTNWGAPLGSICVRRQSSRRLSSLPCYVTLGPAFSPNIIIISSPLPLLVILLVLTWFNGVVQLFYSMSPLVFPSIHASLLPLYPPLGTQRHPSPSPLLLPPFFSSISLPSFTVIGCLLLLSLLPFSLPCSHSCCCVCQCSSFSSRGRRRLGCEIKPTLAIITELASCPC